MKSAAILCLLAGSAAAFAPASVGKTSSSLKVSADLEGMVGTSVETGGKIVSFAFSCFLKKYIGCLVFLTF